MVVREKQAASTSVLVAASQPAPVLLALCDDLYGRLATVENRKKARRAEDEARYRASLLAFVEAIATVALAQIPPFEGIYVSFTTAHYTGSDLSAVHLKKIREGLRELGFIVVGGHWNDPNPRKSYATRIRHTGELSALAQAFGLKLADLVRPPSSVISLADALPDAGEMPADVRASADIVMAYNEFTRAFVLSLPADAWQDLERRVARGWRKDDELRKGFNDGRLYLTRRFKGSWERGGRLYDGYWQNMPKNIRKRLLIDGEATVELDYSRMHPTMIFAEKGLPLTIDPYDCPGYPGMIEAGKDMFQRLLNSASKVKWWKEAGETFKSNSDMSAFRDAIIQHLDVISDTFQRDYGARLQKKDSDLAISILKECMKRAIPVYPVHDSFITKKSRADELRQIMDHEFEKMFGFKCHIK
jgi:hypothetical protein